MRKKIKPVLKDDILEKHYETLHFVTKTKQFFLMPKLTLMDLSDEAGISVDVVKKILNEKMHVTFFEFISRYKINKAKQLLTNTREGQFSISDIAAQSGFNTNDSFSIIFKQHTNISPEAYRIKFYKILPDSSVSNED